MKRLILNALFAVLAITCGYANDGVYFTSGNFLVPVAETDIAVSKEILTITVGRDSFARVDVYYEFLNRDREKTVTMAFEAAAPYNAMEQLRRDGGHPYIHDFTVTMNGQPLKYTNGLVAVRWSDDVCDTDFTPLDVSKWQGAWEMLAFRYIHHVHKCLQNLYLFRIAKDSLLILPLSLISLLPSAVKASQDIYKYRFCRHLCT